MRLRLPEIRNEERWKRSRVVEVKTPELVAELVAGGGIVSDEVKSASPVVEVPAATMAAAPPPPSPETDEPSAPVKPATPVKPAPKRRRK